MTQKIRDWIGKPELDAIDAGSGDAPATVTVHNEQKNDKSGKSLGEIITTASVIISLLTGMVGFLITQNSRLAAVEFLAQSRNNLPGDVKMLDERMKIVEYQNTLSIGDRQEIHTRLDHEDATLSSINAQVAGINAKIDELLARHNGGK